VATYVSASRLCGDLTLMRDMSADDLAQLYRDVMTDLLDHHCPTVTVRSRAKPSTPWFDSECRDTWRVSRHMEKDQSGGETLLENVHGRRQAGLGG